MKKIVALKVLDGYRVWLRFDDGIEGEVDFSDKPRTGVFAPWQDYEFFRGARVGGAGELVWDDQLDFCPDALWLRITGKKPEDLFPNLNSPRSMPEISRFLGISIRTYRDEHLPPHFHAVYNKFSGQIAIHGPALLGGNLPPRVLGFVVEWAVLHEEELLRCWEAARTDQPIGRIAPLV